MGQFAFDEAALKPPVHVPVHVHLQSHSHGYGGGHVQHHARPYSAEDHQRRPGGSSSYGSSSGASHLRPSRDHADAQDHPPRAPASSRSAYSNLSTARQGGGRRAYHGTAAATSAEAAAPSSEPLSTVAPVAAQPMVAAVAVDAASAVVREVPRVAARDAPAHITGVSASKRAGVEQPLPLTTGARLPAPAETRANGASEAATVSLSPSSSCAAGSESGSVLSHSSAATGTGSPVVRPAAPPADFSSSAAATSAAPSSGAAAREATSAGAASVRVAAAASNVAVATWQVLPAAPLPHAGSATSAGTSRSSDTRGNASSTSASGSGRRSSAGSVGGSSSGPIARMLAATPLTPSSLSAADLSSLVGSTGGSAVKLVGLTTMDGAASPLPLSSLVPTANVQTDRPAAPPSPSPALQTPAAPLLAASRSYAAVLRK